MMFFGNYDFVNLYETIYDSETDTLKKQYIATMQPDGTPIFDVDMSNGSDKANYIRLARAYDSYYEDTDLEDDDPECKITYNPGYAEKLFLNRNERLLRLDEFKKSGAPSIIVNNVKNSINTYQDKLIKLCGNSKQSNNTSKLETLIKTDVKLQKELIDAKKLEKDVLAQHKDQYMK